MIYRRIRKEFYNRIEDEKYQERISALFERVKAWENAHGPR